MVEYNQCKWEDLDISAVTSLTKSVYEFEGRGEYSDEQIERHLTTLNERFPTEAIFSATRAGLLIGWTGVERETENIGEIGRWHPYVANVEDRDEIAEKLIAEVIKYAKENRMSRLKISFGDISEESMKAYNCRRTWFEANNWTLVEDTFYMNRESTSEIPDATLPDGYSLHPLLENADDSLYACHYAAFTTSDAREFYGLTENEKRQHFDKLYDRSQSINAEASFVLKKDDEIASMLLVISRDDEEYISVVAVHPNYRGKGLAKALLKEGIQRVREQGVINISIGVDVVNTPAVSLYRKFGFEVMSRLSFYSWSQTD